MHATWSPHAIPSPCFSGLLLGDWIGAGAGETFPRRDGHGDRISATESRTNDGSMNHEEEKKDRAGDEKATLTCDYLVIGAGATGMAFADTMLESSAATNASSAPSVIIVDKHPKPGGQWNDSYSFVRLHQPSKCYGVESEKLEPTEVGEDADTHRATREEILAYYENVCKKLGDKFEFQFIGGTWFDFDQLKNASTEDDDGTLYRLQQQGGTSQAVRVKNKVVDGRYLEPDLPVFVKAKFAYNEASINCIPVNSLSDASFKRTSHYVVIGGGKTGMDAIVYLQTQMNVDPNSIMWIVPSDAWITAREQIGSCMEFLHTCTEIAKQKYKNGEGNDSAKSLEELVKSEDFFQNGFLEWERSGKVYRMKAMPTQLPTKFKDATLCKKEMAVIKKVTRVIGHHGRVKAISDNGDLQFVDGTTLPLPWAASNGGNGADDTTFVHASAGAFNYSKHLDASPPPFGDKVITIQDVYGTPGFCFVGSLFGKLESLGNMLSNDEKNSMCLAPQPDPAQAKQPLGPSGGDVGVISAKHGYVQRVSNLKKWLDVPEMKKWLVGHRLFNLGHLNEQQIVGIVEEVMEVMVEAGLISA